MFLKNFILLLKYKSVSFCVHDIDEIQSFEKYLAVDISCIIINIYKYDKNWGKRVQKNNEKSIKLLNAQ